MPVPEDHLRLLEADLAGRKQWLNTVQVKIAGLQDEVSAHEMILALGSDPAVLQVLHDLHDHPELGEQIGRDPWSFFSERGIRVPREAAVTVTTDPRHVSIEARFATPTFDYGIGWSRPNGFYMVCRRTSTEVVVD
jgi:hypothetical protein